MRRSYSRTKVIRHRLNACGEEMKQLPSHQTRILFHFVKRFYPCKSSPKIAVVLLNQAEWKKLWLAGTDIISPKRTRELRENIDQIIQHFRENPERIEDLPKKEQFIIRQLLRPHFASESIWNVDEHIKEGCGDHYSVKRVKSWLRYTKKPTPEIIQPYMKLDHVIFISHFMNEEQWKIIRGDRRLFRMQICATIFHEMIHVIEEETKTKIFEIGTKEEDMDITTPILQKFLRQYRTFFENILEI